jgi:hypothetical protein
MSRLEGRVGEDGVVDADALQLVLDMPRRLLRGERRRMVS